MHDLEHATAMYLCHGVLTDQFIFRLIEFPANSDSQRSLAKHSLALPIIYQAHIVVFITNQAVWKEKE